jgi:hypothetical protein
MNGRNYIIMPVYYSVFVLLNDYHSLQDIQNSHP